VEGKIYSAALAKIHEKIPFGFSLLAEADRMLPFFYLVKAALQASRPRPKGRGNLNSRRPSFDTGS
jgi:hypothetical protein